MCLEMVSRISYSITFPGIEVRFSCLHFPGCSFLPFLKRRVMSACLQSLGTFPCCHDGIKHVESGLAMTSAGPSTLVGSSLQGLLTYAYPVCLHVTGPNSLPPRIHLPRSSRYPWSLGPEIPEGPYSQ